MAEQRTTARSGNGVPPSSQRPSPSRTEEAPLPAAVRTGAATEVFERRRQFSFLSTERSDTHQPIVRALYENRQRSRPPLSTADLAEELTSRFGIEFRAREHLDGYLRQLASWGVVERSEAVSHEVATLEEYYEGRFTWDLTDAAVQISRFLEVFDPESGAPGTLGPERLRHIHAELGRLVEELRRDEPDASQVLGALTSLGGAVDALRSGVMAFMKTLSDALVVEAAIEERAFLHYKARVVEHIEEFRAARRSYSEPICELIREVECPSTDPPGGDRPDDLASGVDRLVAIAVAADRAVADFRHDGRDATRLHEAEFRRIWEGARDWFLGAQGEASRWQQLNAALRDAIGWITQAVRRLTERRAQRTDAVEEFRALARLFDRQLTDEDCHLLATGALGVFGARHTSFAEEDPEPASGMSWLEVEREQLPAVPVWLRSPDRAKPRGSSARIVDTGMARELARRERERRERSARAALERFAALGPVRLGTLDRLPRDDFLLLRDWIAAALAGRELEDGTHVARSAEGLAEIRLHRHPQRARVTLATEDGELEGEDFLLEVSPA